MGVGHDRGGDDHRGRPGDGRGDWARATISATLGAVTGSTVLTVTAAALQSIAVTPANPTIAKGSTQQFTATGTFSRQHDAEPDGPGDLGVGHDRGGDDHGRRVWRRAWRPGTIDDQRDAGSGQRVDGADGHGGDACSRSR